MKDLGAAEWHGRIVEPSSGINGLRLISFLELEQHKRRMANMAAEKLVEKKQYKSAQTLTTFYTVRFVLNFENNV